MCGWMVLIIVLLTILKLSCSNSDNLALLSSTLKTMQRAACDDEMVALACPKGTTISIQVAQYGKAAPQGHICMASAGNSGEMCSWPNYMQYSLLQTVVEACQKKPQCKFSTKPKPGLADPCPSTQKFIEVAYKCRPYEFRSRTGCAGEMIRLRCSPFSRIAIFEAQFGRLAYESVCLKRLGIVNETCVANRSTETVMHICHGKRRCHIAANARIFSNYNCRRESNPYLKVIYACVPLGVLTEKFESAAEKDELTGSKSDVNNFFDETEEDSGERWSETNIPLPSDPALEGNSDEIEVLTTPRAAVTTLNSNKEVYGFTNTVNHETRKNSDKKIYIYFGVALLVFFLILIILIGGRYYYLHQSRDDSKTGDMFRTDPPNVFSDAMSDIDNTMDHDMEVSHMSGTFYEHPDMILFGPGGKGTLRAMKPLSTIYPCSGVSMYGNVDYVPSTSRIDTNRFSRCKESTEIDPEVLVSPKSMKEGSNSNFFYG